MTSLRFAGVWNTSLTVCLAILLAALAFWWYRRLLQSANVGWVGWWLASLRAACVLIVVLTLLEPAFEMRFRDGDLGEVIILVDASRSMSIVDESLDSGGSKPNRSRYQRSLDALVSKSGLLDQLHNRFDLSVVSSEGTQNRQLWRRSATEASDLPADTAGWMPETWSETSPLGEALDAALALDSDPARTEPPAEESTKPGRPCLQTLVLLSDGQSHTGRSPFEAATRLQQLGKRLYTVGLSPYQEPADLALVNLLIPERLYQTDILQGDLIVSQNQSNGKKFSLTVEYESTVLWQQDFVASAEPQRKISFSLPVAEIYSRASLQLPSDAQYATLPVKLTGRLSLEDGEQNTANNSLAACFTVASHKSRLLLVDGRSRWETRYLKNIFSRDPSWTVESFVQANQPSSSAATLQLPSSKDELFQYDLVILGELEPGTISNELLEWLPEFVEVAGGGLIMIDGARQTLRDDSFAALHRLSPVTWLPMGNKDSDVRFALPKLPQLTPEGKRTEALQLMAGSTAESEHLWSQLPPLQFVSRVQTLPGAEVLVEAVSEVDRFPLLITRRYGGGRVLFSASDETWRWRFKTADLVHSRLWLQLARWVMKSPMSLQSEFVSVDAGSASYQLGQTIPLRCQLRDASGQPHRGDEPTAIISRGDSIVLRLPMHEEGPAGTYSTRIDASEAGDYTFQVVAPGFSSHALDLKAGFSVMVSTNTEMRYVACDERLLQQIAEQTGGEYLRENELDRLVNLLSPLSQGTIKHSVVLLWQTYAWFAAAMLLLCVEWVVRKKVGLA